MTERPASAALPAAAPTAAPGRPLVLVSWDGHSMPLALIHLDATPEFDWVIFDYTGRQTPGARTLRGQAVTVLAAQTECKGEIFFHLAEHLAGLAASADARLSEAVDRRSGANAHETSAAGVNAAIPRGDDDALKPLSAAPWPEYVALIDDDILLSVSQINTALHLGRCERLDIFSPSLSHDSPYSHHWTRHQPHRVYREVPWVEVMMPFYRGDLFMAARPYYRDNISSWGLDRFIFPTLQQLHRRTRTAMLDAVMASHRRPITSGEKVYRNGRTAWQERQLLRQASLDLIDREAPELRQSAWFHQQYVRRETPNKWIRWKRRAARLVTRWLDDSR